MAKQIQFGTGGFRGVIGDDFNKENIQLVAQALADITHETIIKTNNDWSIVLFVFDDDIRKCLSD